MNYCSAMRAFIIITLAAGFSGCRTTDVVSYVHEPTREFSRNWDFSDGTLKPFVLSEIIVAPYFVRTNLETTTIMLSLFSKIGGDTIRIERVVLQSNSKTGEPLADIRIGKSLSLEKEPYMEGHNYAYGLYGAHETLTYVETNKLEDLSAGKSIFLVLYLKSEKEGAKEIKIEFEFKRKVETHVVWPT